MAEGGRPATDSGARTERAATAVALLGGPAFATAGFGVGIGRDAAPGMVAGGALLAALAASFGR